ncbi:DUF922 domain-containing protein [Aurantimonas sp. Leaf443]|uniref:DUF922 domain-containing Zn-dependent protease n=1 Tax=Aurantimonas sp. Leaf443 TaxID=1736378 RepID=UPI0006FD159D|nr:DUF922 domain-containing protein [Aurantimonas sp. Leaf443]KQT86231.1 hypothetical protein ASG48_06595 [Aurantimonas sp. Leaf443]
MRSLIALLASGIVVLSALPAGAATVRESTTYFPVKGRTLAELDASLSRQGPLVTGTGARHPGATEVRFDGHVDYKRVGRLCAVGTPRLALDLKITLPRWVQPRRTAPDVVLVWQTLEKDIRRHEAEHATIAKRWLKKMESAIRNLRPEADCERMEARVNQVTSRYLAAHEREQLAFDAAEGRDVDRRLSRALAKAIEGYPVR